MEQQESLSEFEMFIRQLREEGRRLQGDGFGYIGTLKAAYKKACKALDELNEAIKKKPEEPEAPLGSGDQLDAIGQLVGVQRLNADCWGQGADNLPTCTCRFTYLSSRGLRKLL